MYKLDYDTASKKDKRRIDEVIYSLEQRSDDISSDPKISEVLFKSFLVFLLLGVVDVFLEEMARLFLPETISSIFNIVIFPFVIFVFHAGVTSNIISHFLGYSDIDMSAYKTFFKHTESNLLISELFIIFVIRLLVALISFSPMIYFFREVLFFENVSYYAIAGLLSNNVLEGLVLSFVGLFIYNILIDSLRSFYFNISYNSLIEEFSGFWWNFIGSIKSFFSNKYVLIKSIMINFLYSLSILFSVWIVIEVATVSNQTNPMDLISFTRFIRFFLILLLIALDTIKEVYIDRLIAKMILSE